MLDRTSIRILLVVIVIVLLGLVAITWHCWPAIGGWSWCHFSHCLMGDRPQFGDGTCESVL